MPDNNKQTNQGRQSQRHEGKDHQGRRAGGTENQQQWQQQNDRGQKQNPGTAQSGGRSGMGHDDDEM